jgi:hypothetical protein
MNDVFESHKVKCEQKLLHYKPRVILREYLLLLLEDTGEGTPLLEVHQQVDEVVALVDLMEAEYVAA